MSAILSQLTKPDFFVTVAVGQTESEAFLVGEYNKGGLYLPSNLDGTSLNFKVSVDGTNYVTLPADDGSAAGNITVAASKPYKIPAGVFSFRWCKLVLSSQSGTDTVVYIMLGG